MQRSSFDEAGMNLCWERSAGETVVLGVVGELDLSNSARLQEEALGLTVAGARRLILDLSGMTFIDSAGLSVLFALRRRLPRTCELSLVAPRGATRAVLELVRVPQVLPFFPTLRAALEIEEPDEI